MLTGIFIGVVGALVVLGVIGATAGRRRKCECPGGFTPNHLDGDCAVCRGYEPSPLSEDVVEHLGDLYHVDRTVGPGRKS